VVVLGCMCPMPSINIIIIIIYILCIDNVIFMILRGRNLGKMIVLLIVAYSKNEEA